MADSFTGGGGRYVNAGGGNVVDLGESWAATPTPDEEQGGGGVTGVTAPIQDPWGGDPYDKKMLDNYAMQEMRAQAEAVRKRSGSGFIDDMFSNPEKYGLGGKILPDNYVPPTGEPSPTPEPTPAEPIGGSGTPWYLYKGYGEPTSVQYGFSNTTGYAPGYAPLYNKPTDWRLQGSGVDVARKNDNSPMPQPTKWNAPVTPPPSVTSIPNLPITPQEVNNLKPVVENWKTQNLVYTPEMGNVADTYAFQNQRTRASEPAPFYRDAGANIYRSGPAREPEAQKKYVYDPTKKKPNAFGGGGRGGGGGGGGGNWKAALDTMNWNI